MGVPGQVSRSDDEEKGECEVMEETDVDLDDRLERRLHTIRPSLLAICRVVFLVIVIAQSNYASILSKSFC